MPRLRAVAGGSEELAQASRFLWLRHCANEWPIGRESGDDYGGAVADEFDDDDVRW